MGMDLQLFEDEVPQDLVCKECLKVVVHPVQNACPHLFCSACLRRRLRKEKTRTCPTCNTHLTKEATEPPPVPVTVKLQNLRARCKHGCGKVCRLADQADHVAEECLQAPVTCPLGCPMKVKRAELEQHKHECEFREVKCDACGHRTLLVHLFTHQSQKRCVEKKLRQQFIKATKLTSTGVKQHWENLHRQRIRVEQQQRQRILDHYRNSPSQSRLRQNTRASTNTGPFSSSGEGSIISGSDFNSPRVIPSLNLPDRPPQEEHALRPSVSADVFMTSPRRFRRHQSGRSALESSGEASKTGSAYNSPRVVPTSARGELWSSYEPVSRHGVESDLFLTSSRLDDDLLDDGEMTIALNTPEIRLPTVVTCKNCKKTFRESSNTPNACRWHPGPIVELFGGTCYACGRLDYQKGCMMGYHEL